MKCRYLTWNHEDHQFWLQFGRLHGSHSQTSRFYEIYRTLQDFRQHIRVLTPFFSQPNKRLLKQSSPDTVYAGMGFVSPVKLIGITVSRFKFLKV